MSSIIKRRKTSTYAQIQNDPLQNLEDIRAIGLMSHLMSLPESWEIKKMQLYKKFGRAAISHGINELERKKYWIDIKYREGKKNDHLYYITDVPFEDSEVQEMIEEVQENFKVMEVSEPFSHLVSSSDENQQLKKGDPSIDDFQQLNINNSFSTVENEHLLKEIGIKETNINKQSNKRNIVNNIVNKDEIIHTLTNEYRLKGLSKDLALKVVKEVNQKKDLDNYGGYLRTCLEATLRRVKMKNGDHVDMPDSSQVFLEALNDFEDDESDSKFPF